MVPTNIFTLTVPGSTRRQILTTKVEPRAVSVKMLSKEMKLNLKVNRYLFYFHSY